MNGWRAAGLGRHADATNLQHDRAACRAHHDAEMRAAQSDGKVRAWADMARQDRTAGAASAPSTANGTASPLPIAPAACHAPCAGRTDVPGGSVVDGWRDTGRKTVRIMDWEQSRP